MGTSRRPAVETPTLSDGLEENADLSCSPRLPPRPRLHRPPRKTQFDPGPSPAGQKPEPKLSEHEVLHRQPGHRLRCLGSCSWSWHPVLRQLGVQPVQEPGRHEEQQQQGRQPTTASLATLTSTMGSLDSLEDSPLPPSLRTPVSPQTVGEQQLWVTFG